MPNQKMIIECQEETLKISDSIHSRYRKKNKWERKEKKNNHFQRDCKLVDSEEVVKRHTDTEQDKIVVKPIFSRYRKCSRWEKLSLVGVPPNQTGPIASPSISLDIVIAPNRKNCTFKPKKAVMTCPRETDGPCSTAKSSDDLLMKISVPKCVNERKTIVQERGWNTVLSPSTVLPAGDLQDTPIVKDFLYYLNEILASQPLDWCEVDEKMAAKELERREKAKLVPKVVKRKVRFQQDSAATLV
jgi:hypothetical protein